jgi:tetratricopeptide (TPR) repeat protein
MKLKVFLLAAASIGICESVFSQTQPDMLPRAVGNSQNSQVVLSGKVITSDGSVLSQPAMVIMDCGSNQSRIETPSDSKGEFILSVKLLPNEFASASPQSNTVHAQDWQNCELSAEVPGYTTDHVRLFGNSGSGMVDAGHIMLHPASRAEGSTVSVTSLAAPEKAKAAFEKGQEQEKKGKWSSAIEYFRKAISSYPRYALAWLELGRVQVKTNDFVEAKNSFRQSVAQDSKLPDGYSELARLGVQEKQWKEVVEATNHLVQLLPDEAQYWFLNSAAQFNIGNTAQAESSIQRAIALDTKHLVPQLEYLYSLILARKQEYQAASDHVNAYLRLSPEGKDAPAARLALAEFQKRAQLGSK